MVTLANTTLCPGSLDALSRFRRINKKNSQKDSEQKRSGNYFFFDDGDEEDDVDADDL